MDELIARLAKLWAEEPSKLARPDPYGLLRPWRHSHELELPALRARSTQERG